MILQAPRTVPDGWPVDGHVHFHRPDLVAPTLSAAAANFRTAGSPRGRLLGALLLTQAASEQVFEHLEGCTTLGEWQIERISAEPQSLVACKDDAAIAIVCGRQVRAAGGLEVLALGTRQVFADGRTFGETVREVRASDAFTVLPWGFGKWLGNRGNEVATTLARWGRQQLAVGDNGSRLKTMPMPSLLQNSEREGFRVIPGTDPFPFGRDYRRVGRFGFLIESDVDPGAPWRAIRTGLESRTGSPPRFGAASAPVRFVFNQVGIQVYNRVFR
jgi:hypothetical protein